MFEEHKDIKFAEEEFKVVFKSNKHFRPFIDAFLKVYRKETEEFAAIKKDNDPFLKTDPYEAADEKYLSKALSSLAERLVSMEGGNNFARTDEDIKANIFGEIFGRLLVIFGYGLSHFLGYHSGVSLDNTLRFKKTLWPKNENVELKANLRGEGEEFIKKAVVIRSCLKQLYPQITFIYLQKEIGNCIAKEQGTLTYHPQDLILKERINFLERLKSVFS